MKYKHIFFDLDRTLWDFDTNSRAALTELYTSFQLAQRGVRSPEVFIGVYETINRALWSRYRNGRMSKKHLRKTRFSKTLEHLGCWDASLGIRLEKAYLDLSPLQTAVEPNALETLEYLHKAYKLHIITNGFEEVQHIKLDKSGLGSFFSHVVTSERASARKPGKEVFEFAFALAGTHSGESLMVGDDLETDMAGARNMKMDRAFYNPAKIEHSEDLTYEISDLAELRNLL